MKRPMAAILVADVVGDSGLMEVDEDGTAQRLAKKSVRKLRSRYCDKILDTSNSMGKNQSSELE